MKTFVVEKKILRKYKNALLLIGLPGIGLVSKMAVDHLTHFLKAKKIAALYSPHFPNQVLALKNGRLRPFAMSFYYQKIGSRDVILLKGDLQPMTVEGQHEVTQAILSFAKKIGVNKCISMAGYAVNKKIVSPKIFCSASSKKFFEEMRKQGAGMMPNIVPIVGMAGLLPALSKVYGIQGTCLLVETPGNNIDAQGAKALLSFLSNYLKQEIDCTELDEKALRTEKMLEKMEAQAMQAQRNAEMQANALLAPKKDALNYIR